ncbi:hypothetical protein DXG03_008785 [Asterophora parasitica]|uniref:Uncharacterized protein n=1 Tax=Asterophora parasitica TaxID=117018 RepID=A0A9P7GBZ5_9AGAR|nr:hypothetical protein DXG03_008785 [Asterophora parasitica]
MKAEAIAERNYINATAPPCGRRIRPVCRWALSVSKSVGTAIRESLKTMGNCKTNYYSDPRRYSPERLAWHRNLEVVAKVLAKGCDTQVGSKRIVLSGRDLYLEEPSAPCATYPEVDRAVRRGKAECYLYLGMRAEAIAELDYLNATAQVDPHDL